jgi:hypothetical protein
MPLVAGTVTVSPVGVVVGVGLARDLYDDEVASYGAAFVSAVDPQSIEAKTKIAAKCASWALRMDAFVKSATVTVPGVTPGPTAVIGAIT